MISVTSAAKKEFKRMRRRLSVRVRNECVNRGLDQIGEAYLPLSLGEKGIAFASAHCEKLAG